MRKSNCNKATWVPGPGAWADAAAAGQDGTTGFVEGILQETGSMTAPATSSVQSLMQSACHGAYPEFLSEQVPGNKKKHPAPQTSKTTDINDFTTPTQSNQTNEFVELHAGMPGYYVPV